MSGFIRVKKTKEYTETKFFFPKCIVMETKIVFISNREDYETQKVQITFEINNAETYDCGNCCVVINFIQWHTGFTFWL